MPKNSTLALHWRMERKGGDFSKYTRKGNQMPTYPLVKVTIRDASDPPHDKAYHAKADKVTNDFPAFWSIVRDPDFVRLSYTVGLDTVRIEAIGCEND